MFELILALAFLVGTLHMVRTSFVLPGAGMDLPRLENGSRWLGLLGFAMAFMLLKPQHAGGLVLGLMLHELGHVMAYRLLGYSDLRFRLLPVFAIDPICTATPRSEAQGFFLTLMGAGFSLLPMVAITAAAEFVRPYSQDTYIGLIAIGGTIAALNVVNLLPLRGLDGGRCLHILCASWSHRLAGRAAMGVSAFIAALAIHTQSTTMTLLCLLSLASQIYFPDSFAPHPTPMRRKTALLAGCAYLATFAAHLAGGWWLLTWFFWAHYMV